MDLELANLPVLERYKLLIGLVIPRPIAWISTWSENGVANCAPFSFFNVISEEPPLCIVSFNRRSDGAMKHTLKNIRRSGEFVVNLADEGTANAMHASSAELPESESEFAKAGLTPVPAKMVKHPRIGEAAASLECKVERRIEFGPEREMVVGEILLIHVRDGIVDPATKRISEDYRPVGRLYARRYVTTRQRFDLPGVIATKRASLMTIIDSQVHAYEANTPKRPWDTVPNWPDHVTGDEMVAAMDKVGVDGAIFISAFSLYRYDDSYALEVQRAHPGRLALVKPVDPDNPAVADVIAGWKKTPGAVGIRILMTKEWGCDPDHPGLDRILREAVRHDLPVNLHCWGNLDVGTALIDRYPDTRFIIDHLGIVQPRTSPAPPQAWDDLPKVLNLARRPNAVIKVSGACTLSRKPYPFPDIWEPLARVFDAWGFDRCLWGTDWTRAFALLNYQQAVEPFRLTDRLSKDEKAMLMGGACAKAYGWSPRKAREIPGNTP